MISFPFDNKSAAELDRSVSSDTFAEYLKRIVGTNGIFAELGNKGVVETDEGMSVKVMPVDGFIEGRLFAEKSARKLLVQASENQDRIDTVVVRLDKGQRLIDLYIVKGTAQVIPKPPVLTREAGIYELGLANIFVAKTTDSISQQRITDTRLDSERCGIVPIFGSVDTSALYKQIESDLKDFQNINEAEFISWFEKIKGQLSTDAAGNLQNEIDSLFNTTVNLNNKIVENTGRIYELNEQLFEINSGIQSIKEDTGWKKLPLSANWKGGSGEYCAYRKKGDFVEIRFSVVAKINLNTSKGALLIASGLPRDCLPGGYILRSVCVGQGKTFTLYVNGPSSDNAGKIQFKSLTETLNADSNLVGQVFYMV